MFRDAMLLVIGGTGSFGHAVVDRYLDSDVAETRVFSRNELKQDDMRLQYQSASPALCDKIRFHIGDGRDLQSVANAMHDVDYVYHAAALNQVPSCEFFPMEAVKTNVLGTENVLNAAIRAGVWKVSCLSTDKAAHPVEGVGYHEDKGGTAYEEYTSRSAEQLTVAQIKEKLLALDYIQAELAAWKAR